MLNRPIWELHEILPVDRPCSLNIWLWFIGPNNRTLKVENLNSSSCAQWCWRLWQERRCSCTEHKRGSSQTAGDDVTRPTSRQSTRPASDGSCSIIQCMESCLRLLKRRSRIKRRYNRKLCNHFTVRTEQTVLRDVTPSRMVQIYRHCGGTCCRNAVHFFTCKAVASFNRYIPEHSSLNLGR